MNKDGGAFLSEGGYGCVFYPEISCKGKDTNNNQYISKIVEKDYYSENEINIGKIIQKKLSNLIENPLKNHFAPVISSCDVDIKKFDIEDKEDCDIFNQKTEAQYTLLKIRYIDNKTLDTFITENNNSSLIMQIFTSSYSHLLKSLTFLQKIKVCHFDIKSENIVFDIEKSLPIMIDFGISIDFNTFDLQKINKYFYRYIPTYFIWPIEVHLLNYMLHKNSNITDKEIKDISRQCTNSNIVLRAFSPKFQKKYEDLCYHELKKYVGKDSNFIIKEVTKFWNTWDNYSLSVLFIRILYYLVRNDEGQIIKNEFVVFFTQLCLQNMHPNPSKRLSVAETIKSFNLFLYNIQVNKGTVFEDIIEQIGDNKPVINDIIKKDKKYMTILGDTVNP